MDMATTTTLPVLTNTPTATGLMDMATTTTISSVDNVGNMSDNKRTGLNFGLDVLGINGNLGNHDNMNDFLHNANLLGNNLYMSPMNEGVSNPQKNLEKMGKIDSKFFPMVKII